MTIRAHLLVESKQREGYWVARLPEIGVFTYAPTEAEAMGRLQAAINFLHTGIDDEGEIAARLARANVPFEFDESDSVRRATVVFGGADKDDRIALAIA